MVKHIGEGTDASQKNVTHMQVQGLNKKKKKKGKSTKDSFVDYAIMPYDHKKKIIN